MSAPTRVDHVTAIVPDAVALARTLQVILGQPEASTIELPGMRVFTFRLGDVELHINEPTGEGPVKNALAARGPGFHHVALACHDLDATLEQLRSQGIETAGPPVETAPGLREVFLRPDLTAGIFFQLVERREAGVVSTLDARAVDALANVGRESPAAEDRPEGVRRTKGGVPI